MSYIHTLFDVDRESHIATITLNKPERMNAIDQGDAADILDICKRIQDDDEIWIAIWIGAGRGFCSGADVTGGPRPTLEGASLDRLLDEGSWISRQGNALYGIDKPMIAAVNGVAAGAGFSLALASDVRIGSEAARFVTVFQERNLPPEGGMSWLLPRIVGVSRALDLSLTSRRVDADEALRIGLLDRIVPAERLLDEARSYAQQIGALPPGAVRVSKRAIRRAVETTFVEATRYESQLGSLT
ncbi:MAG: enoyl-CoA hydratase/isomerase family protein [Chloroflexota bacterium]|nr:enoyl-CoA hydratase/isomerase family protein [Chloroflexota bacterium]